MAGGDPGPGGRYGGSGGVLSFTSENPSDSVEELRSSPASGLLTPGILRYVVLMTHPHGGEMMGSAVFFPAFKSLRPTDQRKKQDFS